MRQRNLCLAWFVLHFLLIIIASCRDLFRLVADGLTILPSSFSIAAQHVETIASSALSQNLPGSNLFRRGLITYLHIAGIERGYGYFAPNIPGGYKLVFELHFADGRVAALAGFGKKTAENILAAITARQKHAGRFRQGS